MKVDCKKAFIPFFVKYNAPDGLFPYYPQDIPRSEWTDEQCFNQFQKLLDRGFRKAIIDGKVVSPEAVRGQLVFIENDSRAKFFNEQMQHLLIRFNDKSFIAQTQIDSDETLEVNQIWFIKSSVSNPLMVCATFPNKPSKDRFIDLAGGDYNHAAKLLEKLAQDYMRDNGVEWD